MWDALQQICPQVHDLWSAPIQIVVVISILYQQLGIASVFASIVLLGMFAVQAYIMRCSWNFRKEGLQCADKRIGLMNEFLSAMDIVKCYAWEKSVKAKVLNVRDDEISWFSKAQLLAAVNTFLANAVPVLVTVVAFGKPSFGIWGSSNLNKEWDILLGAKCRSPNFVQHKSRD
jgi:hypothetical protein